MTFHLNVNVAHSLKVWSNSGDQENPSGQCLNSTITLNINKFPCNPYNPEFSKKNCCISGMNVYLNNWSISNLYSEDPDQRNGLVALKS